MINSEKLCAELRAMPWLKEYGREVSIRHVEGNRFEVVFEDQWCRKWTVPVLREADEWCIDLGDYGRIGLYPAGYWAHLAVEAQAKVAEMERMVEMMRVDPKQITTGRSSGSGMCPNCRGYNFSFPPDGKTGEIKCASCEMVIGSVDKTGWRKNKLRITYEVLLRFDHD